MSRETDDLPYYLQPWPTRPVFHPITAATSSMQIRQRAERMVAADERGPVDIFTDRMRERAAINAQPGPRHFVGIVFDDLAEPCPTCRQADCNGCVTGYSDSARDRASEQAVEDWRKRRGL